MDACNNNTSPVHIGAPTQEVVNQMLTIAPGTAREWVKQLLKHYGFAAELSQYRAGRAYARASYAEMGYDNAARSAKLKMSENVLYSKTLHINRLAQAHGLPPVMSGVNRDKGEAVARIIMYAEGLVAQSPYAKYMGGANKVKQKVISQLIILEPKTLEDWIRQVCRLYGLVAEMEQYWILKTHMPFLLSAMEYDFEDRSRELQAEAKAICSGILIVNYLARVHSLPAVLASVGDDIFEMTACFLSYVETLVAQSSYARYMHSEESPAA